jgi:hypothetical protein
VPTINFDLRGSVDDGPTPDLLVSGVDLVNLPGVSQFDRLIILTPAMVAATGIPAGAYEHVGEDSSGNWTYAPARRNT